MTHEHDQGDEPEGGPQHDHRLPDATEIPVADGPFDLAPELWADEWDEWDEAAPQPPTERPPALLDVFGTFAPTIEDD